MNMIDEYRKCAEICAHTDYGNRKSVQRHNNAVSRMYEIVKMLSSNGPDELQSLTDLLNEYTPARWLAHQLIEVAKIPSNIENKCFEIIESSAIVNEADAMGERMWLNEWKKKKGRV